MIGFLARRIAFALTLVFLVSSAGLLLAGLAPGDITQDMFAAGVSPETIARGIDRLIENSRGGCGGFMFRATEWANRADTMKSYELFARWVMPRYQGSIDTLAASQKWARENRPTIFAPSVAAVKKAYTDAGREAPEDYKQRLLGARDTEQKK